MSNWYYKVKNNLSVLPDCIDFFEGEIKAAKVDMSMKNNKSIEKHAAELPGQVEHRYSQLQEIEAILEFLNKNYDKIRSHTFRRFMEGYQKSLTSRDAEKYVDGDDDVFDMAILVNDFALLRNQFLSITKGLEYKHWQLNNVVKLRCAGLDDAGL